MTPTSVDAASVSRPLPVILRFLLMGLAGALMALALAPFYLLPCALISLLTGYYLFGTAARARQAALLGWGYGLGYFAAALFWITEPFQVDAARHGWMAPFALSGMAGGLALFWALAFWAAFRSGRSPRQRLALLILTWTLAEIARAYVLTGFPWAGLSQIWVNWGSALSLAWIGPHGLTWLTLFLAGLPLLLSGAGRGLQMLALMLPALFWAGGELLLRQLPAMTSGGPIVRLVQPNAPQHEKWDPARIPIFFDRQLAFTAAAPRPALVVWPETSLPVLLAQAGPAFDRIEQAADGAPLVLGIQRRTAEGFHNTLVGLDQAGKVAQLYDKHHLVPFGEYIPWRPLVDLLGLGPLADQQGHGFAPGTGPQLLDFGPLGKALPLICYEAIFPQHARAPDTRPDFLIQITNDAWFGQYTGPYQHLAQARMRAMEQGLPMIRVANTGVSAMIDGYGRILRQLPLGEAGFADAALPPALPATLYARIGDWPVLFLLMAICAFGMIWCRRRSQAGE